MSEADCGLKNLDASAGNAETSGKGLTSLIGAVGHSWMDRLHKLELLKFTFSGSFVKVWAI